MKTIAGCYEGPKIYLVYVKKTHHDLNTYKFVPKGSG